MLLFVGVLFAVTATTAPPTAKDVGTEYSINLDTQSFMFVSIALAEVYVYSCESSTIKLITLDSLIFKNDVQVEGLKNLKYPTLNLQSNYNLRTASDNNKRLFGVNYYYRC